MSDSVHDWNTCSDDECDECQRLVDAGIVEVCDECGKPGHTDSLGWRLKGDGRLLCTPCNETLDEIIGAVL
jgi:hypothetical protein